MSIAPLRRCASPSIRGVDPRSCTNRGRALGLSLALAICVSGCGATRTEPATGSEPTTAGPSATESAASSARAEVERRAVIPSVGERSVRAGVSYGPYREGQAPDGVQPSEAQILEDLRIIAPRWNMIRIYSALGVSETILELIRRHQLPIRVMLGAWVAPTTHDGAPLPERVAQNEEELRAAIRLANEYRDEVFAVCVGNETQVEWSWHRSPREQLIESIRRVRAAVAQPVTTADDYNFWNKPESQAVAREIDFLVLHAYAMWNRQEFENAVPWTAATVESIRALHPTLPLFLGETGWATQVHPVGDAARQIVGAFGEAEQARFYREFTAWAAEAELPYFYFEAFDEPWKGGSHPDEVEKHWGLFHVDRTAKEALRDTM